MRAYLVPPIVSNENELTIFAVAKGYKGHIGCEYLPRGQTEDGLQWLDEVME